MERTSEIYNCEPDIENTNPIYSNNMFHNNNERIESIENSIKASLLNPNKIKNNYNECDTTLKVMVCFSLVGIMILLGIVIYLILHKK